MELNIKNIRKKAQGLPLETIVIAVIVVVALVIIIGIFITGTDSTQEDTQNVKSNLIGCNKENPLLADKYSKVEVKNITEDCPKGFLRTVLPKCCGQKK